MKSLALLFALSPVFIPSDIKMPPDHKIDVVLVKYDSNKMGRGEEIAGAVVIQRMNGGRVVTYPDCFAPVLIPKYDLEKVRSCVGKNSLTELSPELK